MDQLWQVPLIALAGVAAGIANVSAGGGSLLTVPLLIFLGLPGPVANGTNRVALIAQNISAVRSFHGGQVSEWGRGLRLAAVALPGAALGAVVGVRIGDQLFRQLLGVALLGMLAFTFLRPRPRQQTHQGRVRLRPATLLSFAFIGFYSGFIQAGVGFLIMFALVGFEGLDLVRTNATKVKVILVLQVLALAIYVAGGMVRWIPGLILAVGTAFGAWLAVRLSLSRGERYLKPALAVCVTVFAIKLIFFS
jgi:uncharacterized membrane protein YfcA